MEYLSSWYWPKKNLLGSMWRLRLLDPGQGRSHSKISKLKYLYNIHILRYVRACSKSKMKKICKFLFWVKISAKDWIRLFKHEFISVLLDVTFFPNSS